MFKTNVIMHSSTESNRPLSTMNIQLVTSVTEQSGVAIETVQNVTAIAPLADDIIKESNRNSGHLNKFDTQSALIKNTTDKFKA
ncbi:MAG: hypothetical protein ACI9ES_002841 [Oceanospirillaceae bacterium]|jgi:hypothetical protein